MKNSREETDDFVPHSDDPLLKILHKVIRIAVKILSILMILVIFWGIIDVVHVLIERLIAPPFLVLRLSDLLEVFGTFLAVLIAIEIYVNITLYLRDDVIHVKLVVATALMAVARKIIIFDFKVIDPHFVYSSAILILSLGLIYWLIAHK